jgi:peptidoglycan/LPS O-acetylase OafA/YrhL
MPPPQAGRSVAAMLRPRLAATLLLVVLLALPTFAAGPGLDETLSETAPTDDGLVAIGATVLVIAVFALRGDPRGIVEQQRARARRPHRGPTTVRPIR